MNKVSVGILDDEKNNREYIALLLNQEFPNAEIVFQVQNMEELEEEMEENIPDIVFLDIMLEGEVIFNSPFIKAIQGLKIFVTAYDHYGIQAVKNNAFDYLLKPINLNEFKLTVYKAIDSVLKIKEKNKLKMADSEFQYTLDLPTSNGYKRVNLKDILWCEADTSYTIVHLTEDQKVLVSKSLANFESLLSQNQFIRIHNKYLINLLHYKEYINGKGGQVILSNGKALDISVRKKSEFLQLLKRL